jgi:hypothetical protein
MIGERARAALRVAVIVVEKDQVDVGRDVQLAPAQLAHADHHQFLHLAGGLPDRLAVQRAQFLADHGNGRAHGKLGQVGHRSRDLIERRDAGQIALNQCTEDFIAQQAQGALERSLDLHGLGVEQFSKARRQPRHVNRLSCAGLHALGPAFARLRLAVEIARIRKCKGQRGSGSLRRAGRSLQKWLGGQGGISHADASSIGGSIHSR